MDFITKLLPSIEGHSGVLYDTILIIVDKLTKYAYFVLYKGTLTVE